MSIGKRALREGIPAVSAISISSGPGKQEMNIKEIRKGAKRSMQGPVRERLLLGFGA